MARGNDKRLGRKSSFTSAQKSEIRIKKDGGMNPTQLSREYGVSLGTIYNVLKGAV